MLLLAGLAALAAQRRRKRQRTVRALPEVPVHPAMYPNPVFGLGAAAKGTLPEHVYDEPDHHPGAIVDHEYLIPRPLTWETPTYEASTEEATYYDSYS